MKHIVWACCYIPAGVTCWGLGLNWWQAGLVSLAFSLSDRLAELTEEAYS